ncbi:hypothetical protein H311_00008 [Anncaliia algerae PRA109]|nr:hypothetical protein H311_00008 [Anncaliia algerae PRA109]
MFFYDLTIISRIITRYACRQPKHGIKRSLYVLNSLIVTVPNKFVGLITARDFPRNKLGITIKVIQNDENMSNFKIMSH